MSDPTSNQSNIIWDDGTQPIQSDTDTIPPPGRPLLTAAAFARRWINVGLGFVLQNTRFLVEVTEAVDNSVLMTKQDLQRLIPSTSLPVPKKFVIRLIQHDTLGAVQTLHQQDPTSKIAILNFANNNVAGGGVLNGAQAQEENLCLRTSLYRSLHRRFYPLSDNEIIYSPDILVAKLNSPTDPVDGILLHEQDQYLIDVISCAAVRQPATKIGPDGLPTYANQQDKDLMQLKLETILSVACSHNIQKLVLGAFGCGVFRNPPHAVAKLMRALLLGSIPPTRSQSAVAVPPPPPPRPRGQGKQGNPGPEPEPESTQAEEPPPTAMPFLSCFALDEIIIPILDTNITANQPTWNAFVDVFRDVADVIIPQGAIVGDVEEIAHHVFPAPVVVPSVETVETANTGNTTGNVTEGAGDNTEVGGNTTFNSLFDGSFINEGTILSGRGDDSGILGGRTETGPGPVELTGNGEGGGENENEEGEGINEPRSLPRPRAKSRPIIGI